MIQFRYFFSPSLSVSHSLITKIITSFGIFAPFSHGVNEIVSQLPYNYELLNHFHLDWSIKRMRKKKKPTYLFIYYTATTYNRILFCCAKNHARQNKLITSAGELSRLGIEQ